MEGYFATLRWQNFRVYVKLPDIVVQNHSGKELCFFGWMSCLICLRFPSRFVALLCSDIVGFCWALRHWDSQNSKRLHFGIVSEQRPTDSFFMFLPGTPKFRQSRTQRHDSCREPNWRHGFFFRPFNRPFNHKLGLSIAYIRSSRPVVCHICGLGFLARRSATSCRHNSHSAARKWHRWLWPFRQRLWSKHVHSERAIYKASDNESRQNELGFDEESEWFGMWFVYKPCLARGRFWIPFQSQTLMARRCADCLVLHAGESPELGHFVFFALTQFFTICCCIESIGGHVGGTQPAPIRIYTTLVCIWSVSCPGGRQDHSDCKILKLAWHSGCSAVDGGSCKFGRVFRHHCNIA